jgi:3-hydroxyacyl-CoA dehydrogenase
MFVFKAAVVGAGTMGGEIAHVIAQSGVPVILKDIEQELVDEGIEKARGVTEEQLQGEVKKGKLEEDDAERRLEAVMDRITGTIEYEGFEGVDFVVEAVPEKMEVKHQIFGELEEVTPGHALLASNTSSLSITEIARGAQRADKVLGFHFFYPASQMRLIEVIPGERTSERSLEIASRFAESLRKLPVRCADSTGFVVNRVLMAAMGEIWKARDGDRLQVEGIDGAVMTVGAAPVPPFYLCDQLGLDTVLGVAEHLNDAFGERFHVSSEVREKVEAGDLGRKSGRGFYDYDA